MDKRKLLMRALLGCGCALGLAGCAMLPDLTVPLAAVPRTPTVVGSTGLLPARQRAGLVKALQRESTSPTLRGHLAVVEAVTGAPLMAGNAAELLVDGPATHHAMLAAIEGARDHINLESYIIEDDSVGRRLADALIRKQAQGVQVNVIYDGIGSLDTPAEYFQRLKQSGIAVCEFNPVNPLKGRWWRLNQRDHRKILVVDGEVGFTGGINFSRVYASSSARRKRRAASLDEGWRDTHIEVRGPAVAEFQRLFIGTWRKQSCGALAERHYFPQLRAEGDKLVRVIGSSPDSQESLMYLTFLSALGQASERIYLTMAYFVPDPRTLTALKNAAARGVDVRLILPGYSDFWVVFHAGRSYYDELLAAGVKLYERRDALLHAKTAVIDGVWSTVGSTNMDWRSFLHNDEVNVVVLGEEFGQHMDALFQRDLAEATPIDPERWRQRSFGLKAKEWLARHWQYLL